MSSRDTDSTADRERTWFGNSPLPNSTDSKEDRAELVHSTALVFVPAQEASPAFVDARLLRLKGMVVDSMTASNSKRNYAKALDHLFAFAAGRPLTRHLLLEWRAFMEKQSPSTVNVRLSAMRSLVGKHGARACFRPTMQKS